MRGDSGSKRRTNAELTNEARPLRDRHVDDDEPVAAVRKIGEISHPYRWSVYSERRIAGRVPSRRLIRHAEPPELARSRRLAHIHEHEDESHLSCHPSAQVKDPEIVEAVAVCPSISGLEVTQLSGIRRIRDVPDEHALAERRSGLSAPVGRDGFERRRQQVAPQRDLKRPCAGRPGRRTACACCSARGRA